MMIYDEHSLPPLSIESLDDNDDVTGTAAEIRDQAAAIVYRAQRDMSDLWRSAQVVYEAMVQELANVTDRLMTGQSAAASEERHHDQEEHNRLQRESANFDRFLPMLRAIDTMLMNAQAQLYGRALATGQLPALGLTPSMEDIAIQAQEEERYRLAREVHDGPAQILANTALQVEYIALAAEHDPSQVKQELHNLHRDLRLATSEVRRFMYDLRPPALTKGGLATAVENHVQRVMERFGLQVSVLIEPCQRLTSVQEVATFRIIQESIQNTVKHAKAKRITVSACAEGDTYMVTIMDDGRGFDTASLATISSEHFGVTGMRARARQIGAQLDVMSTPGQGTCVVVHLPLP